MKAGAMTPIRVIDSHTGGEPTRTIVSELPLQGSSVAEKLESMRRDFDGIRTALIHEPRGSEVMVGALLLPPSDPAAVAGMIFFNNVGYLGMCGHGTIGVVETLRWLGRLQPGFHTLESCVGNVRVELHDDRRVTLVNVPSYRIETNLQIAFDPKTTLSVDIAYGGNYFALTDVSNTDWLDRSASDLTAIASRIMDLVREHYPQVDHVELFGPPKSDQNHSRSFVLCPGGQYDRSPCGTGTSAKLACLAADEKLAPGQIWRQESWIGSVFEGSYQWESLSEKIISPTLSSRAFVKIGRAHV